MVGRPSPPAIAGRLKAMSAALLLFLGGPGALAAPATAWLSSDVPVAFQHLTRAQGLSQGTVTCMLQDHQGYLWFGTERGGLNRYDGLHFTTYHHDAGNPASLASELVTCLMEDHQGRLWVGMDGGGVDCLDPETRTLHAVQAPASGPSGFGLDVSALAEDAQSNVWVGTEAEGLFVLPGGKPSPAGGGRGLPRELTWGGVGCLHADRQGTLWVGMQDQGVFQLTPGRDGGLGTFRFLAPDPRHPEASAPADCLDLARDDQGMLWIGTKAGLYRYDPSSGASRRFRSLPGDPTSLKGNLVRRVYLDRAGALWVGTDGGGLHKLLPGRPGAPARFRRISHDPRSGDSLASDAVESIFEDRSGVLWVGTFATGLNKLVLNPGRKDERERPSVRRFGFNPADPASLSGNLVNTMVEDRFGALWVGTDGAGVNRLAPPRGPGAPLRFERFATVPATGSQNDTLTCSFLGADGALWLGSYTGGLIKVEQASAGARPSFRHYLPNPAHPESTDNFILMAGEDHAGRLWVCPSGGALQRFDPRSGTFTKVRPANPPAAWNAGGDYGDLGEDAYGTLWLASRDGVDRFNPDTGEMRTYRREGRPGALGCQSVNDLLVTHDGHLYLACDGGLETAVIPPWTGAAPVFAHFGTPEGLPGDLAMGLVEDRQGALWVSTDGGLCRFDPAQGRAFPFPWQQYLPDAEAFHKAFYLARSGEVLFGGSNGLFLFDPAALFANQLPGPVVITDFQVFGKSVPLSAYAKDPADPLRITLTAKESLVSFEFAALHYAAPEANHYEYLLEGLESRWNATGNRHFVTYTTLPSGNYTLRVRAFNCDGSPCGEDLKLRIQVRPPFTRTLWFWLPLAAALLGLTALLLRYRLRHLHRRTAELERVVAERTQELAQANQALLDQSLTDALTGLHNRRYLDATIPGIMSQALRTHRNGVDGRSKVNLHTMFAMVDLDHFKRVNDTYGHQAGDVVLRQVGEILKNVARTSDTSVRMGGEEFLVIAHPTALMDATILPERIRRAVELHPFTLPTGGPLHLTCSVGFCLFPIVPPGQEKHSWEQVLGFADECLYAAKDQGRNAWVGAVPEGLEPPSGSEVPTALAELVEAGLLKVVTSLGKPVDPKFG